jgi:hypothetical protein
MVYLCDAAVYVKTRDIVNRQMWYALCPLCKVIHSGAVRTGVLVVRINKELRQRIIFLTKEEAINPRNAC